VNYKLDRGLVCCNSMTVTGRGDFFRWTGAWANSQPVTSSTGNTKMRERAMRFIGLYSIENST
jgi:hypothetical protein